MDTSWESDATLEWFGGTTFRLKAKGLTVFLDSFLERPPTMETYMKIADVEECDYILISHAHFDHLPGADRLAKSTGAIIIGNGEAISVMRGAGVPEHQLMPVSGGERIPLFTKAQRDAAASEAASNPQPEPPGAPPQPNASKAPILIHAWPSLHCLLPDGDVRSFPESLDSGTVYTGSANKFACTLDITQALTYGIGGLLKMPQFPPQMPDDVKSFFTWMKDRENNRYSYFDGGQIMYNFLFGNKVMLWNGHTGAYDGIMKGLEPKPDIALLAIAGRANLNGRPFDGSAADFVVNEIKWIGEPSRVIWHLHDRGAINPKFMKTEAATEKVHKETKSKVVDLEPAKMYKLFEL